MMLGIFRQKWTNIKRKRFYSGLIRKNDLCFDIGANIGAKSMLFLSLGARVVAFEPQSACANSLRKIKNQNFIFKSVAVGGSNEERELNLSCHIEVATISNDFKDYYNDETDWFEKETVVMKTLDSFIVEFGVPDFCKIDVEGYEWEILSKLTYSIPIIEFEFTGGFISLTLKIIALLDNGSTAYNYILNEQPKFELDAWINCNQMIAIINNLPISKMHGNIFVKR